MTAPSIADEERAAQMIQRVLGLSGPEQVRALACALAETAARARNEAEQRMLKKYENAADTSLELIEEPGGPAVRGAGEGGEERMRLLHGDSLTELPMLPDNSVDSLVTDPPAGISFMGKTWDHDHGGRLHWIGKMALFFAECHRVMKPGAHGLVWALPRTSHWTATALEEAGFELRDVIYHCFGSGFPKSLDVSKAIDKAAGAEREVIGKNPNHREAEDVCTMLGNPHTGDGSITAPATDDAKRWQGFGTALKPAVENWILIRKPCSEKTVAANVLKWGTGALNIDGCRVACDGGSPSQRVRQSNYTQKSWDRSAPEVYAAARPGEALGRFPSHLILDEEAGAQLDAQSLAGGMHSAGKKRGKGLAEQKNDGALFGVGNHEGNGMRFGDSGGASRFFYCAKVSASERNAGLEEMEAKEVRRHGDRAPDVGRQPQKALLEKNSHPTVKPQKLMRYLCRLITPPGGTVLDPFMGSGSTGLAALTEGFRFIGIEQDAEYFEIARNRIESKEPGGPDAS